MKVYLLYVSPDGGDNKLVGIFSSLEIAKQQIHFMIDKSIEIWGDDEDCHFTENDFFVEDGFRLDHLLHNLL